MRPETALSVTQTYSFGNIEAQIVLRRYWNYFYSPLELDTASAHSLVAYDPTLIYSSPFPFATVYSHYDSSRLAELKVRRAYLVD